MLQVSGHDHHQAINSVIFEMKVYTPWTRGEDFQYMDT